MSKINVFFANGHEEIEALTVIDLLRRAGLEVSIVSINDGLEVIGAHNIKIIADVLLKDVDFNNGDMIVLPGGMPGTTNLGECKLLTEQLLKYNNAQREYVKIVFDYNVARAKLELSISMMPEDIKLTEEKNKVNGNKK